MSYIWVSWSQDNKVASNMIKTGAIARSSSTSLRSNNCYIRVYKTCPSGIATYSWASLRLNALSIISLGTWLYSKLQRCDIGSVANPYIYVSFLVIVSPIWFICIQSISAYTRMCFWFYFNPRNIRMIPYINAKRVAVDPLRRYPLEVSVTVSLCLVD